MDDGTGKWRDPVRGSREQRIEGMILEHQARHGGKTPTQKAISAAVGGSLREVSPEIRRVQDRLAARQARDQALPEVPEDLARMAEEFAKEAWHRASRHGDAAAAALRSARAADQARREQECRETDELLGELEEERDAALARAGTAEARVEELDQEVAELRKDLDAARERLAEREEILALLRAGAGAGAGTRAGTEPKSKSSRPAKRDEPPADDGDPAVEETRGFEPQDLPMGLAAQPRVG